jgi:hypothetical protein
MKLELGYTPSRVTVPSQIITGALTVGGLATFNGLIQVNEFMTFADEKGIRGGIADDDLLDIAAWDKDGAAYVNLMRFVGGVNEPYTSIEQNAIIATSKHLRFRDNGIYIHSINDGQLSITADGNIVFNTPIAQLNTTDRIQFRDAGQYISSEGANILALRATSTIQNRVSDVTIDEKLSHHGDVDTYFSFTGANDMVFYAGADLIMQIDNIDTSTPRIGFFGVTPSQQQTHLADPADEAALVTWAASINAMLEWYGLKASS